MAGESLTTRLFNIWNSRICQRILAAVYFCLYICDICTDFLVGYDLIRRCHVIFGSVSILILTLPGKDLKLLFSFYPCCMHLLNWLPWQQNWSRIYLLRQNVPIFLPLAHFLHEICKKSAIFRKKVSASDKYL